MGQSAATESHLKVVPSADTSKPKKGKAEPPMGSKAWAEGKRDEARAIVGAIDTQYIVLGKILWDLYDIPVDNNPGGKPVYSLFGYAKFEDFCDQELGLHYRKAYTFRSIYYRLHIELKDLDAALRDRIVALGWTKVRGISRVLTMVNALSWVEYAEKHTASEIDKKVSAQLDEARKKKAVEEGLGFEAAAAGASFGEAAEPSGTASKKKSPKKATSTPEATDAVDSAETFGGDLMPSFDEAHTTELDKSDEPIFDPSIVDINTKMKRVFYLEPGENELLEQALSLSKQLSGKDVVGVNLSLICLEFTATNDATARPNMQDEFKLLMLAQVEKLLGVELLAVDPKSGNPIYASVSLKKKAGDG